MVSNMRNIMSSNDVVAQRERKNERGGEREREIYSVLN